MRLYEKNLKKDSFPKYYDELMKELIAFGDYPDYHVPNAEGESKDIYKIALSYLNGTTSTSYHFNFN